MKKSALFFALGGLLLLALPAVAASKSYYVPPGQFNAAVQVMDRGFANIFGLFEQATGSFAFDTQTDTLSHVRLAMSADSLTASNMNAAGELRALFDTNAYPEITFMATANAAFKDGKAEVKGTLTTHGQSKPATFEATLNQVDKAAIGLSLKGSFRRADFGMGDPPEMPGRFGETITLMLEMQALRQ